MSENLNKTDPLKTHAAQIPNCDRAGCNKIASFKPVIQLKSSTLEKPCESFMDLKVCSSCATKENALDLISGDEARTMFENIFKVQSQGKQVDWSCSGVAWVSIN